MVEFVKVRIFLALSFMKPFIASRAIPMEARPSHRASRTTLN